MADEPVFICKPEHLVRQISPLEAEEENQVIDPLDLTPSIPFGHFNRALGRFLSDFRLDDEHELWFFEVPKGSKTGQHNIYEGPLSGYAKVLKGKVCGEFLVEGN